MTIMEESQSPENVGDSSPMKPGKSKVLVRDLNPQITCPLCGGYFIDATTVVECLHTFCRTCIVSYLELSEYCPVCDVTVHASKPLLGIRQDRLLQDLVYKLVPGLFTSETERKKEFYSQNPRHFALDSIEPSTQEQHTDLILDNEQISISLEFQDRLKHKGKQPVEEDSQTEHVESVLEKMYLLCPVQLSIKVLERFIRAKFDIPTSYQIELYHTGEPLQGHYTMRDLVYIYSWQKTAPFKLFFTAFEVLTKETLPQEETASESLIGRSKQCKQPFDSDIESTDSDCSDATYLPPVVQIKQEPVAIRRPRGRPYKRRGTNRLMYSQRGWDSHIKKQKRQPTGRPRGRPRKHMNLFHSQDDPAYHCNVPASDVVLVKRPRGWPKGKPRKRKILPMENQDATTVSRPFKRPRGRPRKGFQPRYCSTPHNPLPLLRNVKQENTEEENLDCGAMRSHHHHQTYDGNAICQVSTHGPVSTSIPHVCLLPKSNESSRKDIRFLKSGPRSTQITASDTDEAVTSFSRNVGRVHWIYRKRKMPIPSIPVSLKLNKNDIGELVRKNRPTSDTFLRHPHRKEQPPDSTSCSSEDGSGALNFLNTLQGGVNSICDIPTTHTVASSVGNKTQSHARSVISRNIYIDDNNTEPQYVVGGTQGLSYSYNHGSHANSSQEPSPTNQSTHISDAIYPRQYSSQNQTNDGSFYSQVSIKDINQRMAARGMPPSSRRNCDGFPAVAMAHTTTTTTTTTKESGHSQSHNAVQMEQGSLMEDPCEAVLRSMSKNRLLYLLKRCTAEPSHSLHESTLLGQRRGKEGDSLEEDSLEEKPSSPIVERFRPLNINLQ